mmetsp:Transcript_9461/g.20956  ORF Transcript_9461/g.20956 Transcript_9461/m.20956 type:complete len:296 (-) Transcript_9461:368-1255(-)
MAKPQGRGRLPRIRCGVLRDLRGPRHEVDDDQRALDQLLHGVPAGRARARQVQRPLPLPAGQLLHRALHSSAQHAERARGGGAPVPHRLPLPRGADRHRGQPGLGRTHHFLPGRPGGCCETQAVPDRLVPRPHLPGPLPPCDGAECGRQAASVHCGAAAAFAEQLRLPGSEPLLFQILLRPHAGAAGGGAGQGRGGVGVRRACGGEQHRQRGAADRAAGRERLAAHRTLGIPRSHHVRARQVRRCAGGGKALQLLYDLDPLQPPPRRGWSGQPRRAHLHHGERLRRPGGGSDECG